MFWNFLASHRKSSPAQSVPSQGGFGLVELMVSVSIMVIISAVILAKQNSFNSAVLLRGQTYEIALSVREVQLSAISASSDGTGNFRSSVGVHFSTSTTANADGRYQIFNDANDDGYSGVSEETGTQGILDNRFHIRNIRIDGNPLPSSETDISIVFERPNFDAIFYDASGNLMNNVSTVEIDVARRGASGTGVEVLRTLEISKTGQITVK